MSTETSTSIEQLRKYADLLLESIVSRDPSILPLASRYRATENAIPANLSMMSSYRLVSRVNAVGATLADPVLGNVVVFANVDYGAAPTVWWARLHVTDGLIDELEIYHTSSRSEAGYVMQADEIAAGWPEAWTRDVAPEALPTRAELEHLGRAVYDTRLEGPGSAETCVLMEQGGIVREYADFMELMFGEALPEHAPEDVTEMYGVGLDPFRPHDGESRLWTVDEENGIVAVIGTVRGVVMPTVTRAANISAFVPDSMVEMHGRSILPDWLEGRSVLHQDMPVTSFNTQIWRLYDGKIQGMQMYNFLTAAGAEDIWK